MSNKNRLMIFILIIITLSLAVSSVSASEVGSEDDLNITNADEISLDDSPDVLRSADEDTDSVGKSYDENILSAETGQFWNLDYAINKNSNTDIYLTCDFRVNTKNDRNFTSGIVIDRTLTIHGNGHTINGITMARAFDVRAANVVFENITFSSCGHYNDGDSYNGGAIRVSDFAYHPQAINCTFDSCEGWIGGALYGVDAINCTFINCYANNAGAMYSGTASNCTFIRNGIGINGRPDCVDGGATYLTDVYNCSFIQNAASHYGGACCYAEIENCYFKENHAVQEGGAVYAPRYEARNSIFISNYVTSFTGQGGAIRSLFSNASTINCTFIGNNAHNGGGQAFGICILPIFENNQASIGPNYYSSTLIRPDITVPNVTVQYPSQVEIPVKLTYSNDEFDGFNISATLYKDGIELDKYYCLSGSSLILNLDAGIYTMNFSIVGPYLVEDKTSNIHVKGVSTRVNVTDIEMYVGDDKYLIATLLDGETQNPLPDFDVKVTSTSFNGILKTDSEGKLKFALKDLPYGTYNYKFIFSGMNEYENAAGAAVVKVKKTDTVIDSSDMTIVYGENANITAKLSDENNNALAGADLNVKLNGVPYTLTTNQTGYVCLPIPILPANTYAVEITYPGNQTHNNANKNVNVHIIKLETEISSANVRALFNEGKVIANLTDSDGAPLSDLYISVAVGNKNPGATTDSNGIAEIDLGDLAEGQYSATVSFAGTQLYKSSSTKINVLIGKYETRFISHTDSFVYNEGGLLSVKLVDEFNNALADKKVYAFENGVLLQELTTDENGEVALEIDRNKLPGDDYSITFRFDETSSHKGSTDSVKYAVTKIPTQIVSANVSAQYNNDSVFTVTLNDKYGNGIENEVITVKSNVETWTGVTDSSGQASFHTIGLPSGIHDAAIIFAGDDIYEKSLENIAIVIDKASSGQVDDPKNHTRVIYAVYGGTKYFTVTLNGLKGNPLNDTNVTVTLNNQTSILKTDKNGQINVSIEGLKPQNYNATVTFEGNETLEELTTVVNLIIVNAPSKVTAHGFTAYYPDGGYLNITLKDGFGNNITDADVNIKLNNQTFVETTDEMGRIKFFANLTAGIYNATVTYDGDERYISSSTVAYIHIKKVYTVLNATGFTTVYNDGKNLVVTLKDINGNEIENVNVTFRINDETFVRTTNSSGQASLFVDLLPKQYHSTIIFEGNERYHNSYVNANITVNKLNTVLNASGITTVYGNGKYLVANLTDINGNPIENAEVSIRLNNETFVKTTDGSGHVSLFVDLLPKSYYAKVTFDGDDRYINSYVNVPVVVNKLATVLNASGFTTVYGDGKYLVANLTDINGNPIDNVNVSIKLNDVTHVKTTDGSGQVSLFADLLPKKYNALIVFDGDERYVNSYVNVPVVVNRLDTVMEVSGFTADYGDAKYVVATLKDVNGNPVENVNVSIKLNGVTHVKATDGSGQVSLLADLLPKYYYASAVFAGDERYGASSAGANVTVNKLSTTLNATGFTTVYGEGKYLVATLKDVNGNPVKNAEVSIRLDNETYVKTTDGSGQVSLFADLLPKNYNAQIVFDGDEKHLNSYVNVPVVVNRLDTVMEVSGFTADYGDAKYVVATLMDANGKPIENAEISIKLDNKDYVKTTDASGRVSLLADLLPKYYYASAVFAGDERYGASSAGANVTVNKLSTTLNATGFTTVYGEGKYLVATLKDEHGKPVENAEVSIRLDNETYVKTTDGSGQVSLFADLLAKQYNAVVIFDGDEIYLNSYATAPIVVNRLDTVMEASGFTTAYGDAKYVVATLKDVNGNPVENAEVSIKLNNVTHIKTTDASGQVKLLADLLPKYYHATVLFAGDDRYGASYASVNVTVNKLSTAINATGVTMDYGDTEYLFATLKDVNGNPVENAEVSIKLNNVTHVKTTDSSGRASLLIDLLPKQYTAVIVFAGDKIYSSSYARANVIVNKVPAVLDASSITTVYNDGKYLVATLKDSNGNNIENTDVYLTVDNETYVRTTDSSGQVSFLVDLMPKQYNAVISIAGDDRYADSHITVPVVVKRIGTQVNATGFTTIYGKAKYVVATLTDEYGNPLKNKNISVKFVSTTYVASTDENGQMKLQLSLIPKLYKTVVTFEGDDEYIKSTTTVKIVVNKATPKLVAPKKTFKKSVKVKKYTITLKTNKNKPMKNKKVTLKVNKKTYKVKTNSKGKAVFKITNLKKKGTFKAVVKYSGNAYYKAKAVYGIIKVK